jgi:hypothetical protein
MEINSCSVNSTTNNAAEIIVHFTVLPLGRTEYSFVSSHEWKFKEKQVPVPRRDF